MDDEPASKDNQIRTIRIARGFTLQDVGTAVGMTPTHLSRIERGTRSLSPRWARKIAAALGVDVAALTSERPAVPLSRLIFSAMEQPRSSDSKPELNRTFLVDCFALCSAVIIGESRRHLTPREAFANALILHDFFIDTYLRVGLSEALASAMEQTLAVKVYGGAAEGAPKVNSLFAGAFRPRRESPEEDNQD
jgi:transcriptional regulator with XRE-family HTH domain